MGSVATTPKMTPAPLSVSPKIKTLCAVLMFLGLAAFIFTLTQNKERAWHGYLTAYAYFFILAIGGLFFASVQHITKAGWSVNVRRFSEALASYLPVAFVLGLVLLASGHNLWEWMDKAAVAEDAILQHKSGYLNIPFFVIRMVLFFGVWMLFYKKMVGRSLEQDKSGDDNITHKTVPWSVAFLLFFSLSFSLFMVDILMSLQPHWFSTVFGVYCFAGLFQSTMAAMILLIVYCMRKGLLTGWVDDNHLHDLGKFMFGFTVFWAYIAYSQYMLMWYANLPEETIFYQPRVTGAWTWVSMALLMGKFVVPFLALLPRWAKRVHTHLVALSIWTLVMQYVDIYWLVYPNLDDKDVIFGLPEVLIFGGFAGLFIFVVTRFLSQNAIVPVKDPRIHESLKHEVIY